MFTKWKQIKIDDIFLEKSSKFEMKHWSKKKTYLIKLKKNEPKRRI